MRKIRLPRRARRRASRGTALMEITIALLLVALAVTSMVGMLLESGSQKTRIQDNEQATLYVNKLLQALGSYVTADPSAGTYSMAPSCCWDFVSPPGASGPAAPCSGAGTCPASWALDSTSAAQGHCTSVAGYNVNGCHDASAAMLPACGATNPVPPCTGTPYNAYLIYTVSATGAVQARLDWTEPQ